MDVTRSHALSLVLIVTAVAAPTGCDDGDDRAASGSQSLPDDSLAVASGPRTVNWFASAEPGDAYERSIAACNRKARGRYRIHYVRLPADVDRQHDLVARRLDAEDSTVDLINMDVTWTAEFADAGWIEPWEGRRADVTRLDRLEGPRETIDFEGRTWAIPFTADTQLLWFRKDRVPRPPEGFSWSEMIDAAERQGRDIEVQAGRNEGLMVWVNALVAGAQGALTNSAGVDDTAELAARIVKRLANSPAAPPGMATSTEDDARLGFESGRSNYQVNYPSVYRSAAKAGRGFQRKIGWAPYPATVAGLGSRAPLGGFNIAVGGYSRKKRLAFAAAECLASADSQLVAAVDGGLPPTSRAVYDRAATRKAFPFADLLRLSIDIARPRSATPRYAALSDAVQQVFHPPADVDPEAVPDELRDRLRSELP